MNITDFLAEVEARAEKAVGGPWKAEAIKAASMGFFSDAEAEFCAAARTDIPRLVALCREQKRIGDKMESRLSEEGHSGSREWRELQEREVKDG